MILSQAESSLHVEHGFPIWEPVWFSALSSYNGPCHRQDRHAYILHSFHHRDLSASYFGGDHGNRVLISEASLLQGGCSRILNNGNKNRLIRLARPWTSINSNFFHIQFCHNNLSSSSNIRFISSADRASHASNMDDNALKRKRAASGLQAPITPVTPTFESKLPTLAVQHDKPSQIIPISAEGDAIIVLSNVAGFSNKLVCHLRPPMISLTPHRIGMRVSIEVLSITSPELKRLLAQAPLFADAVDPKHKQLKVLDLAGDNGTAMCTLLNVLHLRNDNLPARIEPIDLSRFVEVAAKYQCIPAASRATSPWFDRIFTRHPNPPLYQMTQAALVLGDAIYFARFSSRWVLNEALTQLSTPTVPMTAPHRMLSRALLQRLQDGLEVLRADVDDLILPLADTMSNDATHYVDNPPGDDPTPVSMGGDPNPVHCVVDREGAIEYFSALRDAKIWPAPTWPDKNLKTTIDAIANFRIPEYDSSESCHFCIHIEDEFVAGVDDLKAAQRERLWGLCLDCYKFGGVNPGDCRYEHSKPVVTTLAVRSLGNASGRQS